MNREDLQIIKEQIAPRVMNGEISLLLGAGFSIVNKSTLGSLPTGDRLKEMILEKCNRVGGAKTTLKDAYVLGSRAIPDFNSYLATCFTVSSVFDWQRKIFQYAWGRVYTTNIDNVLQCAYEEQEKIGRLGGDFSFFNYSDAGLINNTIGTIPVVTMHGTCARLDDGFIFSTLEYAKASTKVLDWHRDLAAKILTGGLVVVGNQLDETDIDTYLVSRERDYESSEIPPMNWIVAPNPDEIKADNLRAAGYYVIDATAEDFFKELFSVVRPRSIAEIALETVPMIKKATASAKAKTWFRGNFSHVPSSIDEASNKKGILRHFLTGYDPEWFYIVNSAHASTSKHADLTAKIGSIVQSNTSGVGVLHVTGPSGSGKTTAIKSSLVNLKTTYDCIYEFDENGVIDSTLLRVIIENLSEKSIFVFYSASEYYYAVNHIWDTLKDRKIPYCLFILEDRVSEYERNRRQLGRKIQNEKFELGMLSIADARKIAEKIEEHGLEYDKFSEYSLDVRAKKLYDKERGYGGDLLTALFSLTTHENFELKIYQDYHSAQEGLERDVLNIVSIVNSLGLQIPINYISGALGQRVEDIASCISNEMAGILHFDAKSSAVRCRHRIIANYYFDNCISGRGDIGLLIALLEFLSRQFSVEDIKFHPLPYRIYKELISFEFIYGKYFSKATRRAETERTYHEGQRYFKKDGIFWLHYGRFYRKLDQLEPAIDCFRTGLEYFDSFQTKHSLGTALLELYVETNCTNEAYYDEGIGLLEHERLRRGSDDAYPTTALIDLLIKVLSKAPDKESAKDSLRECINFGLKHFKDDRFFNELIKMHLNNNSRLGDQKGRPGRAKGKR